MLYILTPLVNSRVQILITRTISCDISCVISHTPPTPFRSQTPDTSPKQRTANETVRMSLCKH